MRTAQVCDKCRVRKAKVTSQPQLQSHHTSPTTSFTHSFPIPTVRRRPSRVRKMSYPRVSLSLCPRAACCATAEGRQCWIGATAAVQEAGSPPRTDCHLASPMQSAQEYPAHQRHCARDPRPSPPLQRFVRCRHRRVSSSACLVHTRCSTCGVPPSHGKVTRTVRHDITVDGVRGQGRKRDVEQRPRHASHRGQHVGPVFQALCRRPVIPRGFSHTQISRTDGRRCGLHYPGSS